MEKNKINPGIKKTVEWLNLKGFKTCDSGDGKTHDFECDRDYPYVCMLVDPEKLISETNRLSDLLLHELNLEVYSVSLERTPCIQATYDPTNRFGIIDLMYVDDKVFEL